MELHWVVGRCCWCQPWPTHSVLEAQKTAENSLTYCIDAVWDWQIQIDTNLTSNRHFDSRVRRNCKGGTLAVWAKSEAAAGADFSFVGENKAGLCYLIRDSVTPILASGRSGANIDIPDPAISSGITRNSGCVGHAYAGDHTLVNIPAKYPYSPVSPVCSDARITYGASTYSLTSVDRRSCSS